MLLLSGSPSIASGQPFVLHAAAGATAIDRGYSVAAGVGVSPTSHITVLVNLERTHLASRVRSVPPGGSSAFRGGTLTLAAVELRIALKGRNRFGPYGLVGFAVGRSRPNVNDTFPNMNGVTNEARARFYGGGIDVPVGKRVSLFADARLMLGDEAGELLALVPIRVGASWRF